jgi:hypothetical protein
MHVPHIVVVIGVTLLWLYVVAAVVVLIPAAIRSVFRYRLWRIRDAIVEDQMSGVLTDAPLVNALIEGVERVIRNSAKVTILEWEMKHRLPERRALASERFFERGLKQLTSEQQHRILGHLEEFDGAIERQLFLGSPFGWIAFAVYGLVYVARQFSQSGFSWLLRRDFVSSMIKSLRRLPHDKLGNDGRCWLFVRHFMNDQWGHPARETWLRAGVN